MLDIHSIMINIELVKLRKRFGPPIFFQHKCGKSYKSTIIFYEHSRTIQVYSEIT